MPQLPVILTAFANNSDEAYLSHLEKEHDRLLDILAPLSYLRHILLSSAKTGQLVSTLTQYQNELLTLHFGGHADGSQLHFKDTGGQVAGLAENLSLHPQLKLVFLNGCNTQAQAVQFAKVFYTALAKGAMKLVNGVTLRSGWLHPGSHLANPKDHHGQPHPPCQSMVDNANNSSDIRRFLQKIKGLNWHILFTSHRSVVMTDPNSEYIITGLPPELARKLFKRNHTEASAYLKALLDRFLLAVRTPFVSKYSAKTSPP